MILTNSLINEIFKAFFIQRWNDKIRPVDLIEMDKHAHKVIIAYCIGKYEEKQGKDVNWLMLIKGSIYELLRRIVISDIKSPIYYKIRQDYKEIYKKMNRWVYDNLSPFFNDEEIKNELWDFLYEDSFLDEATRKILNAAHKYASYWEFQIVKFANPGGYQIIETEKEFLSELDTYLEFIGIRKLMSKQSIADFVDLCGQLRFQIRWQQLPRLPKTSVLGHSMFVAIMSYFLALENKSCPRRLYNSFFGGIFHDIPEIATRDIISPVKNFSKEFESLIKEIEQSLAENELYPLLEDNMKDEIKYFTQDEFKNKIYSNEKAIENLSVDDLNEKYNKNQFNPMDGEVIKAADRLSAFLEAWYSMKFGVRNDEFTDSMNNIKSRYINSKFGNVNMEEIYRNY